MIAWTMLLLCCTLTSDHHGINFVLLCFQSLCLIYFSRNGKVLRLRAYCLHGMAFVEHHTQNWICFYIQFHIAYFLQ